MIRHQTSNQQIPSRQCSLIFLFLFFWKKARKTTKKKRMFFPAEPLKSLGKKGKPLKKARSSLQKRKKEGISKKQGKEDQLGFRRVSAPIKTRQPAGMYPFSKEKSCKDSFEKPMCTIWGQDIFRHPYLSSKESFCQENC